MCTIQPLQPDSYTKFSNSRNSGQLTGLGKNGTPRLYHHSASDERRQEIIITSTTRALEATIHLLSSNSRVHKTAILVLPENNWTASWPEPMSPEHVSLDSMPGGRARLDWGPGVSDFPSSLYEFERWWNFFYNPVEFHFPVRVSSHAKFLSKIGTGDSQIFGLALHPKVSASDIGEFQCQIPSVQPLSYRCEMEGTGDLKDSQIILPVTQTISIREWSESSLLLHRLVFPARRIVRVVKAVPVTSPTRKEFPDGTATKF